jgi:hypothetical protein
MRIGCVGGFAKDFRSEFFHRQMAISQVMLSVSVEGPQCRNDVLGAVLW